jgi:hypothetical protein
VSGKIIKSDFSEKLLGRLRLMFDAFIRQFFQFFSGVEISMLKFDGFFG